MLEQCYSELASFSFLLMVKVIEKRQVQSDFLKAFGRDKTFLPAASCCNPVIPNKIEHIRLLIKQTFLIFSENVFYPPQARIE